MTWQDELQHLDAELAAGRISAEEYRSRRDAVLGRAQGEQGAPAPGSPPAGVPQQGPPGQNPFPPAFSWSEAAKSANSESSTQIVPNPINQQPPPNQQPPAPGPGQPPQAPAWQDPQAGWGQPTWNAPASGGTPWGDADLPPEHGDTSWMRQGPEVFDSAGKPSKGKKVAGIAIGVVLVVIVAVAAVFAITSMNGSGGNNQAGGDNSGQQNQAPPTPTTTPLPEPPPAKPAPPPPAQVLISPPGKPHPFNGPLPPPELQGSKSGLVTTPVRNFALQNGMVSGWVSGSDGAPKVMLVAIEMPNESVAKKLAERYLDDQEGLVEDEDVSYQGVKVYASKQAGNFRTAYTSHNWTIIVDVGPGQGQSVEQLFTDVLNQQLTNMPPTVTE